MGFEIFEESTSKVVEKGMREIAMNLIESNERDIKSEVIGLKKDVIFLTGNVQALQTRLDSLERDNREELRRSHDDLNQKIDAGFKDSHDKILSLATKIERSSTEVNGLFSEAKNAVIATLLACTAGLLATLAVVVWWILQSGLLG